MTGVALALAAMVWTAPGGGAQSRRPAPVAAEPQPAPARPAPPALPPGAPPTVPPTPPPGTASVPFPTPAGPGAGCAFCGLPVPPSRTGPIVTAAAAITLDAAGLLVAGSVALLRRRRR